MLREHQHKRGAFPNLDNYQVSIKQPTMLTALLGASFVLSVATAM